MRKSIPGWRGYARISASYKPTWTYSRVTGLQPPGLCFISGSGMSQLGQKRKIRQALYGSASGARFRGSVSRPVTVCTWLGLIAFALQFGGDIHLAAADCDFPFPSLVPVLFHTDCVLAR
jgi:hypothetical protein